MGSILLVETDRETRDRWAAAMREAGHDVVLASTTSDAMLRINEGGIDAIVVDSYDPRVGIVELARSLNALPETPPVVLVSASRHAPQVSAQIGAAAFLPKPCDPAELVGVVDRLVSAVRPVPELRGRGTNRTARPERMNR